MFPDTGFRVINQGRKSLRRFRLYGPENLVVFFPRDGVMFFSS